MKKTAIFAWVLAGMIIMSLVVRVISLLGNRTSMPDILTQVSNWGWAVCLPIFGIVAALIVSRQPRNVIGWLLFLPATTGLLDADSYIRSFSTAPAHPPLLLFLALWYSGSSWLQLIFPLFFIPVLFPTGRPPSPRWRWLIFFGLGMCAIFIFLSVFSQTYSPIDTSLNWTIANPIGFIPNEVFGSLFLTLWSLGLVLMTFLSAASLFIRYRRAIALERQQIKWLLYACAIFAVSYTGSFPIITLWTGTILNDVANLLWGLGLIGIPVSIAISILRYRLWDIDLVIRRTLQYSLLTVLLGMMYFGGVLLLQQVFRSLAGQESDLALVLSTLAIAALFTPLRRRLQSVVDQRFDRGHYNAEVILQRFVLRSRSQADLSQLSGQLVSTVQDTVQPKGVSLWLAEEKGLSPAVLAEKPFVPRGRPPKEDHVLSNKEAG